MIWVIPKYTHTRLPIKTIAAKNKRSQNIIQKERNTRKPVLPRDTKTEEIKLRYPHIQNRGLGNRHTLASSNNT